MLRREAIVGVGTFLTMFAASVAGGYASASPTVLAYSALVGLCAGGAMGILAALATRLHGANAHYEPITGEAGAWGIGEMDEIGRKK